MKRINYEEVVDELYLFQDRFGKVHEFGWWYLERILAEVGMQFTPTEFQDEYQTRGVWLALAAPKHQEMNGKNIVYDRILTYDTCGSFEILNLFCINVYGRLYIIGTNNRRLDKRIQ